jgi:hypothetical protein
VNVAVVRAINEACPRGISPGGRHASSLQPCLPVGQHGQRPRALRLCRDGAQEPLAVACDIV